MEDSLFTVFPSRLRALSSLSLAARMLFRVADILQVVCGVLVNSLRATKLTLSCWLLQQHWDLALELHKPVHTVTVRALRLWLILYIYIV